MLLKFYILSFLAVLVNSSPPLQHDPVGYTLSEWPEEIIDENRNTRFKLPQSVTPTHYRLFIRPILDDGPEQFNAPGDVNITLVCNEATNSIILNSLNIVIDTSATMVIHEGTNEQFLITSQSYDATTETFHIQLGRELEKFGNYFLFLKFNSSVADSTNGLYRSHYFHPETGEQIWLATTQFQRSAARKAFPCFDEPGIKSVFEISLGHSDRHHALCNMDIAATETMPGHQNWTWTHFNKTPLMPTYLLAMIVSDFAKIDAEPGLYRKTLSLIGHAAKHHIDNKGADFAVHEGARIMTYFEELYQLDFPLPKVDNAAIPQFAAGAMENWGLITYREPDMLYFNGTTTEAIRKRILLVVAHEIAHFWFGDIVTCKEWTDIWLNEGKGFATYVSAVGVQFSQPEFQGMNFLITDSIQTSLEYDSSPTSVPVSNDGPNPSRIIYDKGASIIRMMFAFLSESTFMKGINKYLLENSYGNVVQDQLFEYLNEAAMEDGKLPENVTMKMIMDTWTLQANFPLVRVSRATNDRIIVSQEKFTLSTTPNKFQNPNDLWWTPISIISQEYPNFVPENYSPKFWLSNTKVSTSYAINTTQWLIVNPDIQNFYRVLYDKYLYTLIKEQLDRNSTVFSIGTRSQLIDDYFSFAYNNYERIEQALELTTFLNQESELFIWIPTFKHLLKSSNYFSGQIHYEHLKAYLLPKIESALESIGVEHLPGAKGTSVILRVQLLDWACAFNSQLCIDYTNALHTRWVETPAENPVEFDIQQVIYCSISSNVENGLAFALEKYGNNSGKNVQRGFWRNALGCVSTENVQSLLDTLMAENSDIDQADINTIFQQVTRNSDAREHLFTYMEANLQAIIDRHGNGTITSICRQLAEHYSTEADLAKYQAFLEANQDALIPIYQQLQQNVIIIRTNILWMTNFGNDISTWMENKNKPPTAK